MPRHTGIHWCSQTQDFGRLFDAVVETTAKNFWDKERLIAIGWKKRAAEVRQSVVDAPSLEEAANRINALLGELKTSHTALLTPDEVNYYILMAVFRGASMSQEAFDDRFWGAGVTLRRHRSLLGADRRSATSSTRCWKDLRPLARA